jgi:regulator of sirC expression with transglutaminase-like and TPR domain
MNYDLPLQPEFKDFKRLNQSCLTGAMLVSQLLNNNTNNVWIIEEIARLSLQVRSSKESPLEILRKLGLEGFSGATNYYTYDNSAIETVLRTKKGIPISLAVVLIAVADELQVECYGVNFPGHFLVQLGELLADPFTMEPISDELTQQWLRQSGLSREDAFKVAGPVDIVVRMLNNLLSLAIGKSDFNKALDFSAYQLLLVDDPFPVHFGRIDLWAKLGLPSMAKKEIEFALALAPSPEAESLLAKRLQSLSDWKKKLH